MPPKRTSRRGESLGGAHTPTVTMPRPQRPPSPLSPARLSRMEEKKEMRNLNDRLASYIDRVRAQQVEISQLQREVSTVEEVKTTEVVTMRNAYNAEMAQLRQALDETAKAKAKFEIDANKFQKEARELKPKLKEKENLYDQASKDLNALQARFSGVSTELASANNELRTLKPENAKLLKKLEDAKRNLEDETLKRIDLQNQLQTSQEGMKFENQLLEQQLNETRIRKQMEISEIDGQLHEKYEEKLQQSLAELRDSYERQMGENREEFNRVYDTKLKSLQDKLDHERIHSSGNAQEVRELETKVTGLTSRNIELESSNTSLTQRMNDLIRQMEDAAKNFRSQMAKKDAEVQSKEEQMAEMLKDYRDLMEIKVALDMEIAAYRKLLEGEEARLGMSQSGSPSDLATPPARGVKRKRTTVFEEEIIELVSEHTGKGNVVVEPLDKDGKFICVRNASDDAINIGGWTLVNTTGGQEVSYKFHRSTALQPGDICTVWSSDAQQNHEPPLSLVMKRGGWTIGEENTTILMNKEGEEEGARVSRKEKSLSGSSRFGSSQLYSQTGEEGKNCIVM